MKKIQVITNDKIFIKKKLFSTKYNDMVNIFEALQQKFRIQLISRISKSKENFSLKLKKSISIINLRSIIFSKKSNFENIFIISITPRNFFYFLMINKIKKNIKGFVFLRSNGHKEYQAKFGFTGYYFYDLMQTIIQKKLKVISVSKNITSSRINFFITPSEIDKKWSIKLVKPDLRSPKILYFGRFKKEKGFFSLLRIFKKINPGYKLTLAGDTYSLKHNNNINIIGELNKPEEIINLYDNHNIFILPSFTEGSPKVILESLSRQRPVIIFKEISHVKKNYEGIFICDRNYYSLKKKIDFIIKNYIKIQNKMKKNKLETKRLFQSQLIKILNV